MIQTNCPNCGDTVTFRSEYSTHAVCASCDTLIVRQGSGVENLGKVAEIQQDGSPLQLGVQGSYNGRTFQILGRIQLQYGDGYWNEWHLMYSNGETGWLGEAMGEYFLSFEQKGAQVPASSGQVALGDRLELAGETFVVTGTTNNQLSAYEGELPFVIEQQGVFQAFDLRSTSGKAATIDYSDSPPSVYVGEYKSFQDLKFTGTRQEGDSPPEGMGVRVAAQAAVQNFNCPSCGAPHSVEGGVRSKVLVCEYCGSAVDITSSNLSVIWQEQQMRQTLAGGTSIPLGSKGQIDGLEYSVIGYLKKFVTYEGIKYPWVEYLLFNWTNGYRWLVESDGHFTLMDTIENLPTAGGQPVGRPNPEAIEWDGKTFKHFQTSTATVEAVAGEFYWKVRVGESAVNFDFVAPPELLSMEASEWGFVWARGVYKTPEEIQAMFGLNTPLKEPVGVAPAQPNPHGETAREMWKIFKLVAAAGFVLLLTGILSGSTGTVYQTKGQVYKTFYDNPPQESETFKIGGHGNVAFDFEGKPTDRWLYIHAELVNQQTQKSYPAGTTLERFYGKGSWSHSVRVSGVPKGEYRLKWRTESGTTTTVADKPDSSKQATSKSINYSVAVRRGVRVWGWYWFMLLVLLPLPVIASGKSSSFETRRWYNSDYG